ncbi:MAG: putative actin patch assembly and actin polymerization protein [Icmadophila ericetorum]|nr:putative actin patch assembly and actin polymerization protein [Icmadophila ericetorum]
MFSGEKKPYSAVTVQIERLTSEQYEVEDFSGIVDLIEVIRLQSSGPTEAARAIRKKLKYGNVHRQLRALTILDGLIQNAGTRFQKTFADEPLLERLRVAATDPLSDAEVKAKCGILFRQWAVAYKSTPGLDRIASLYKQLPQRKKLLRQEQSKVIRETEVDAEHDSEEESGHRASSSMSAGSLRSAISPASPTTPSRTRTLSLTPAVPLGPVVQPVQKYDKYGKKIKNKPSKAPKPFNLEKEKPQLLQTIAASSVATTNLMNAMKLINRENKRVSEDKEVLSRFETCKTLRRQVLRYIQQVESEQWLGTLINANDELVNALITFEVLDKSVDDDSDSEVESNDNAGGGSKGKGHDHDVVPKGLSGLSLGGENRPEQPPRPGFNISMPAANSKGKAQEEAEEEDVEEEDEDDPFADRNAVQTPHVENGGMTW